jgi:nitroimidazol reductase NimA-like FMN-containing flavoprotein (pyridoxamine 5'-phosphate oxidase superfamily)
MSTPPPSPRTRARRKPARASYERKTIDAILDEALVAHVGFVHEGEPYVIPTLHARVGDLLYFHGSAGSRTIRALAEGTPMCLTATLLDGLVLARSAAHHSVNYRSAMVFGVARAVEGAAEHAAALRAFMERLVPGRWEEVRPPTDKELKSIRVLAIPLNEASAKVRSGPPLDDEEDYQLDAWAGVIPLQLSAGAPLPDPRLTDGIAPSTAVCDWTPARYSAADAG